MNAFIVVNSYIKNQSQISQADRIREELENLGVKTQIKKNFCLSKISDGEVESPRGYDFCVYLDKDKSSARLLEKSGIRLFNSAAAMEVCDNKMLTHIALANRNIAMPDCMYAPLCYYADAEPDRGFLQEVTDTLGLPLVAKTSYGSLGAGVKLIKSEQELVHFEKLNMLTEHFYQKYIDCGKGEDTRVIVIGGRPVCAMTRSNANDFRSNIELGGKGSNCAIDENLSALCMKVSNLLGLDYCGIDVLTDRDGNRYICEVNSNAFFATAEKVCGVNIAKKYAEYMLQTIKMP